MKLQVLCGIVPKLQEFYRPDFSTRVVKMLIRGKGVFQEVNLKNMKNNDKILKTYSLIFRNKPRNINVPYKYANWM